MIVLKERAEIKITYPLETFDGKENIVFFDIETTGFSRKYCHIYLIGCMYYIGDTLMYTQWLAENKNEEANILMAFYQFIKKFSTIIHFNGNSFDMPFVKVRGEKYRLDFDFTQFQCIDIYKSVSGISHILKMENQKQKTYENLLGIERTDPFSGGELIEVYREYLRTKDERLLLPLLLHNKEDVLNMGKLLSLYAVYDLFEGNFTVSDLTVRSFEGISQEQKKEVQILLQLKNPIPVKISYGFENLYLNAQDDRAMLTVSSIHENLKLFYDNPKEYYYLPLEDEAVHKSLSMFVDSKYRKAATRETCYKKISDDYIPLYGECAGFLTIFKRRYADQYGFVPLDALDLANAPDYARHLFAYLMKNK